MARSGPSSRRGAALPSWPIGYARWHSRGINSERSPVLAIWSIGRLHKVVELGLVASIVVCITRIFTVREWVR